MSQKHSTMGDRKRSAKFYDLRIKDCKDCKDCPGLPSGATAIVKQDAWKEIEEYDHVVYHDHQGVAHIGFINFTNNSIVLTKSLLLAMFPVQPIILVRKEIKV